MCSVLPDLRQFMDCLGSAGGMIGGVKEMINRLKSYLVFTSLIYRVLMYLVVPMVLVGVVFGAGGGVSAAVLAAALLPMVETVSDNWLFGGIQTKDSAKMDFLKTSGRGMSIMRNALCMDLFRKFLTAVIVLGICYLLFLWTGGYEMVQNIQEVDVVLRMVIYGVSVSWFFSVLGTFFTRYGSLLWFNVMVGYIMTLLEAACWYLPGWREHFVIYSFLYLVLGIVISMLAVKVAMKKVEGGYYDK